jgi:trk system potassium uptake protein
VAKAALQRLAAPAAFDTEAFLADKAQLLGIMIDEDCPVINTPLRQLSDLFSTLRAIVVGLRRDGRLFAPTPDDQIFAGDACYIFADVQDIARTFEIFGKQQAKQDRIVIIGGGNVGLAVARALESRAQKVRVKVIEKSRARAEIAADSLDRTIVLHGDGLDSALLEEAAIASADAVLVVTDDDKTNLLAAVRAKEMGCRMAICLVNDTTLVPLMGPLNIDAYINPRATTVSSILRHIRHGRVRWVYSIGDAEAEMIEAQVLGTSPIAGKKIRDIPFPDGVLVGGVMKADKLVKLSGQTRIDEGDVVVLFAMAADVPEVERLLQVTIDFF